MGTPEMTLQSLVRLHESNPLGRIYLASPYTHKETIIRTQRWRKVSRMTAHMTRAGIIVFSPILHGHPLHDIVTLPRTTDFWARIDGSFLEHWAELLVVYQIDGWKESVGIRHEMEHAVRLQIPTIMLKEATL